MRVTDHRLVDMSTAATQKNQAKVAELADETSTGMRVGKPSDDPVAWLTAQRAHVRQTLSDGAGKAVDSGHDRLVATDGALSQLSDILSRVRVLAVQGANDTLSAGDRTSLGVEARALFTSAVGAANSRAGDGEYLLAGTNSLAQPFDATTGAYTGDAVTNSVTTDQTTTQVATIAGTSLTAANGVDVLPLLDRLATAFAANDLTTIRASFDDLEKATAQVSSTRSHTGAMMSVLEQAKTAQGELATRLSTTISDAVEADTVTAASELAKATQALEVSRAVSTHIISMLGPTSTQ